jgi:hypothetical protein
MKLKVAFLSLLIFCGTLHLIAQNQQDSTRLVRIETIDGNEFVGEIIKTDTEKIYLLTKNLGEIGIPLLQIKSQEKIQKEQIVKGQLWFPNPQATRYFWSPNGYGLKKGEGYYQNIWVLWNQFAYGVTDNFSVGGGVIPLFLFAGAPTPVFGTMKLSLPLENEKLNIGFGGIFGTVLGESETGIGILYGISTFGTPDNNVSFGLGYGYAFGELAESPMININGMFRISSRAYFITENYYINAGGDGVVMLSLGGRWIIKKAALDFALVMPVFDVSEFIAIPLLGFTVPFGTKK